MRLKAYAKLNLSLRVFEKRADGFHNIESVMQSISLHDIVTLTPLESGIQLTTNNLQLPVDNRNTAYKAAELFVSQVAGHKSQVKGCKIYIEKNIPVAAGLGGGSADAAAVLFGLNQMMKDERSDFALRASSRRQGTKDELLEIGMQVGSDVPFCLVGGTCLVKGRGEIVEKQEPWPKTYFVLVCPDIQISAKWAYEEFDRMHIRVPEEIKNDLEQVVVSKYEVVSEIKEKLLSLGCSEAQMSGSGPSVFGVVRHKAEAEEIFAKVKEVAAKLALPSRSFLVETVDKGIEICKYSVNFV